MSRLAPIPYQKLLKVFEKEGFTFRRQSGDHLVYAKPGIKRPLVIPMYDAVPVFVMARQTLAPGAEATPAR